MRTTTVVMLLLGLCATAWGKPKIAVLGVEVVGVSDKDTVRIADELTAALRARPRSGQGPYELAPGSEKALTDEKTRVKCETEVPVCMAKIGADLGADVLLYGKLEKKPGAAAGYQVMLRILNVAKKSTAMTWTELVPLADTAGAKLVDRATRGYKKLTGEPDETAAVGPAQAGAPVPADPVCDPVPHVEKGNSQMSAGNYAAALSSYEAALRCKVEEATLAKAFVVSCRLKNMAKAKHYYAKLPAAKQQTLVQVCIQQNIDPRP